MRRIGYARVSTADQKLNLQIDALKAARCDRIVREKAMSAVARERPKFERLLRSLAPGDTLVVWKLDRAFRSTIAAILTLEKLRERGVEIVSITEGIDTTTARGRKNYRDMASDAEYEREIVIERTKAGLEAARARGVRLGRPFKLTSRQIRRARERLERGELLVAVAASYRCKPETLRRSVERLRAVHQ